MKDKDKTMKKLLIILAVFTMTAGFYGVAFAGDGISGEMPDHYTGLRFDTGEKALKGLQDHNARIAEMLKDEGELDFLVLEDIHEISYTLEKAIDKLTAEKAAAEETLTAVGEAVQALHQASESRDEAKTREWFAKLESATARIMNAEDSIGTEGQSVKKDVYEIVIKNHKFMPEEMRVPAGKKIRLLVNNQDPTPEEFESYDFNREKIIAGNSKATIFIGPLKPGKYHYFGEFNMDSANGYIIAE
jgi:plastocyanin